MSSNMYIKNHCLNWKPRKDQSIFKYTLERIGKEWDRKKIGNGYKKDRKGMIILLLSFFYPFAIRFLSFFQSFFIRFLSLRSHLFYSIAIPFLSVSNPFAFPSFWYSVINNGTDMKVRARAKSQHILSFIWRTTFDFVLK